MKKITGYLTNFTAPAAGTSEGKFKDDPGDGTGSGAVVQTINDVWYGLAAIAKKYIGGISDTDETESASDMMDSIETAIGIKNENVLEYDNTTTYAQDDIVMYLGLQFVSMEAANTGNAPLDYPDKWFACFSRDDVVQKWRDGVNISGGFAALHNKRDATNYRLLFEAGEYNFGGDSGRNFQATGLHLDGTQVTANPTLVALLDVGGANEYHLLDVIAPDIIGIRTLIDSLARTDRVVDDTAGLTENVGVVQEDALQRITGGFTRLYAEAATTASGAFSSSLNSSNRATSGVSDGVYDYSFNNNNSTSPNAAKTNDEETIMKNYTVGVPYVLIMQEI